jgi:hypothetical protein
MKTSENLQQCPAGGFFVLGRSRRAPFRAESGKKSRVEAMARPSGFRHAAGSDFQHRPLVPKGGIRRPGVRYPLKKSFDSTATSVRFLALSFRMICRR